MKDKKGKVFKIFISILTLLCLVASAYCIYNILLLNTIETVIRYIVIGILVILDLIILVKNIIILKSKKRKKHVVLILVLILYLIINFLLGFGINYLYGKLSNMNKKKVTYSTSLVVLKDSKINSIDDVKDLDIGIISDTSTTDYIIAQTIIYTNKLNENDNLINYDQTSELIQALYDGEVDAIFITSSYADKFSTTTGYENIKEETRIIVSESKEMDNQDANITSTSKSSEITEPFTVLLMGVDSDSSTLSSSTSFNGDSLILVTFNPDTLNVTMLSIHRDSYVPIACFAGQKENKITHAAWQGASCMIKTIENLTSIPINYYVKIDFKGVVDLVNAVGGVEIDVPYALCEQNSKRQFGNNTIYIEEGFQTLDGEKALAYSRNRHTWPAYCPAKYNTHYRSDEIRAMHQQEVIKAILAKIKTVKSVDAFTGILDSISNNIETNFTPSQILSFYNIAKDIVSQNNDDGGELLSIQSLELLTTSQKIYDESMRMVLYDEIVNQQSLKQVISAMKINLGQEEPTIIKSFSYSANDPYEQTNPGYTKTSAKLYDLMPNLVGKSKTYATSWASSNNISITWNTVASGGDDGEIISQSAPVSKRLDLISGRNVTLTVVSKSSSNTTITKDDDEDEDDKKPNPSASPTPTKTPTPTATPTATPTPSSSPKPTPSNNSSSVDE